MIMITSSIISKTLLSTYMVSMQLMNESKTNIAEPVWNLGLDTIYFSFSLLFKKSWNNVNLFQNLKREGYK